MQSEKESSYLSIGQKVPNKEKIYFGFGVFANTAIVGVVSLALLHYYVDIFKLNLELFVWANVIYLIWNTLNDVIFGYYSDKSTSEKGRRLPYIRYGAPFFAIAFIYFWFPLPGTYPGDVNNGQMMKFFQLVSAFLFFDTMLTIVILSFISLPPEMSESTEERTKISFVRTIFNLIGALTVFLVSELLLLGIDIFRMFVIGLAIFSTICYIIVSYGVHERKQLHEAKEDDPQLTVVQEFKIVFRNRAFLSFIVYNFCVIFIQTLMVNFAFFIVLIFQAEGSGTGTMVLVSLFIGNLVIVPLFTVLSDKVESRTMILWTSIISLVGIILLFSIDLLVDITAVYWGILVIDGLMLGLGVFYYPYMSDAVDVDELETNQRREGMFFGMNALLTKPAENLPAILGGLILIWIAYVPNGTALEQPASTILGLKLMIAVIPMITFGLLILSQLFNPLKGEYYKELKLNIMTLHDKKEKKV
ncbi:MAG: MFS transporter [Promethearchaeota archaeon]|nr:MAG: MFS transporter [Candidatus Lokiarchaeota archaeon]